MFIVFKIAPYFAVVRGLTGPENKIMDEGNVFGLRTSNRGGVLMGDFILNKLGTLQKIYFPPYLAALGQYWKITT